LSWVELAERIVTVLPSNGNCVAFFGKRMATVSAGITTWNSETGFTVSAVALVVELADPDALKPLPTADPDMVPLEVVLALAKVDENGHRLNVVSFVTIETSFRKSTMVPSFSRPAYRSSAYPSLVLRP
jgi:hypothetical protein